MLANTQVSWGLDGTLALVTGCCSGIGRATSEELAAGGAKVVGVDISDQVTDLPFPALQANVASAAEVAAAVAQIVGDHGVPDLLCNIAGGLSKISDPEMDEWEQTIATNLSTARLMSEALYPRMKAGSSIVNVSSLAGVVMGFDPSYAAAKAGVLGMTRSHARMLGSQGIRVNCVVPGVIDTPLWSPEGVDAGWVDAVPLGRAGVAADVARAIAFLCSPAAAYVSGAALFVDGGLSVALGPRAD